MEAANDMQDSSGSWHRGLSVEADFVRNHTKATLTNSISDTVVALDDLVIKHNEFEDKVDSKLSLVHSRLDKLSRAQVKQVSMHAFEILLVFYFL